MRRRLAVLAAIVVAAVLALAAYYGHAVIVAGAGFKARVLCSGVFVSGRSVAELRREELAIAGLESLHLVATSVDRAARRASAGVAGLIERSAIHRPGLGCTLVPRAGGLAPMAAPARAADSGAGDAAEASASRSPRPALRAVVERAFAEPDSGPPRRTRAVVVVHEGRVVAERYADGYGPRTPLPGWSMAKSVVNALVGILVRRGELDPGAPAPVPAWSGPDDPRRRITVDQLLHMESGLAFEEDYDDPFSDVIRMLFRARDNAAYAAGRPLEAAPGSRWHYSSGNTNILCGVIRRVVGETAYASFPRRALFAPLGMDSAVLEPDAAGNFVGSSFMYASARDWARFGELYANDGVWRGRRILPRGWAERSTKPAPNAPGGRYGAHFWLALPASHHAARPAALPPGAIHALGHDGQRLTIVPSRDTVIVRLGLTRDRGAWRHDRFVADILAALER